MLVCHWLVGQFAWSVGLSIYHCHQLACWLLVCRLLVIVGSVSLVIIIAVIISRFRQSLYSSGHRSHTFISLSLLVASLLRLAGRHCRQLLVVAVTMRLLVVTSLSLLLPSGLMVI
jgi:hypothetical protein